MQSLDPEHYGAFPARGANNIAVGCEFLVRGVHSYHDLLERTRDITNPPYTEAQYRTGGSLYRRWARTFNLPWEAIEAMRPSIPCERKTQSRLFPGIVCGIGSIGRRELLAVDPLHVLMKSFGLANREQYDSLV